jgi:hypothetical protein
MQKERVQPLSNKHCVAPRLDTLSKIFHRRRRRTTSPSSQPIPSNRFQFWFDLKREVPLTGSISSIRNDEELQIDRVWTLQRQHFAKRPELEVKSVEPDSIF